MAGKKQKISAKQAEERRQAALDRQRRAGVRHSMGPALAQQPRAGCGALYRALSGHRQE